MLSATRRGFCQSSTRFIRPSIITASSCICLFSTGRYLQSNYQKRNMSAFALPEDLATNPLLQEWSTPFGIPPFNVLQPAHYEPALTFAMKHHLDEVRAIAAAEHAEGATFANIIAPFDRSGTLLYKVCETFENLCSSNGVPELQAVELKMASPLAAHSNAIMTIPGLFAKIDAVYTARHSSGLNDEQIRLVERYHLDFVRAGAKFTPEMQERYGKIVEELAELSTKFTQNVMADEADIFVKLESAEDKAGLPADLVSAAEQAARERNIPGEHPCIITLSRSLVEPFLTYSTRRDLREKAWKLWTKRGELNPEKINYPLAVRMLELRNEQARMHGHTSFAAFSTVDTMAGSPHRVMELLEKVWTRAKSSIDHERHELENYIKAHDSLAASADGIKIEPWDWRFYAEKVRSTNYNLDNSLIKPYFPLNRMINAIFDCANNLFGLTFHERKDIPAYHPDVQVYEVHRDNQVVAIFLHDNYARPHKRSGAWMSSFRTQHRNHANGSTDSIIPIIINNNNFNKPSSADEPCLLSFDDAVTLFHEFGHGLHGMLSNVSYRRLSGTSVLKDFVELPSQLYEHWLSEPVVLAKHARHYATNEVIPDELLQRLMKARKFNQGFQTIEYTASALVDIYLHLIESPSKDLDLIEFEKETLAKLGMPDGVVMRHRLPHFQHLFSGEFYASGYYVYLWAEVLDADGFEAFTETGDCFNKDVAQRVFQHIYSAGNSKDPAELYRLFRGRDPVIEPMLRKKGLLNE